MADWSEIEKLQEAFQRTQKSSTAQKLSERNCIEILSKLQDMKLIDVIHTQDGKEYLTPKHLNREIRDEIYIHGGRVNLVDIQQALNVDFTHVEAKANELVKSDRNLQLILGQIIQSSYLDQLAEDINDTLQSSGQITIAEISKSYDLPGDFLLPELTKRLGQIIDGQIDQHNKDAILCRDVASFDWFATLINQLHEKLSSSNNPDLLSVGLYLTNSAQEADVTEKATSLKRCKMAVGRPPIGELLQNTATCHPGTTIGVFCCGPPGLISSVRHHCFQTTSNCKAKFVFSKESF